VARVAGFDRAVTERMPPTSTAETPAARGAAHDTTPKGRIDAPLALAGGLAIWALLVAGPLLRGIAIPKVTPTVWILMALPLGVLAVALRSRSAVGLIAGVPFSHLPLLLTQPVLTSPKAHDAASFAALLIATFALVASGSGLRPRGRPETNAADAVETPARFPRWRDASLLIAFAVALLVPLLRLGFDLGVRARFTQSHGPDATRAMTLTGLLIFTGWAISARSAIASLGGDTSALVRSLALERARLQQSGEIRFNLALAVLFAIAASLALYAYLAGDLGAGSAGSAP
jgi:hypothetical protein